ALADDGDAAPRPALGHVGEMDELRRLRAALRDAEIRPHGQLLAVLPLESLEVNHSTLGDLSRARGEETRRDRVGRLIDEIARQAGGGGPGLAHAPALARGGVVAALRSADG